MKTSTVVIALLLAGVLYWVYESNPGNIFMRGTAGAP